MNFLFFPYLILLFFQISETNNLFGSRTEYEEAQTFLDSPLSPYKISHKMRRFTNDLFPHYDVITLTSFSRHGSRSPTLSKINSINGFCLRHKVVLKDSENYCGSRWNTSFNANLTETGKNTEFRRGKWFAHTFKDFLTKSDNEEPIKVITSPKPRAVESYEAFSVGLNTTVKIQAHVDEDLVRFYDKCKKHKKQQKSAVVKQVFDILGRDPLVGPILGRLNRSLNRSVTLKEAVLLYDHCFSETTYFRNSQFCDLFPFPGEIAVMEAVHDISRFWKSGKGFEANYLTACNLLEKMYDFLKSHVEGKNREKALFIFGHAEGLFPLQSLLGLFDEDYGCYRNSNIKEIIQNRFLSRTAIPYSGNIAFLLMKKKNNLNSNASYTGFGAVVLLHEFVMKMPFCERVVCKWDELVKYHKIIKKTTHGCDFESLCENH